MPLGLALFGLIVYFLTIAKGCQCKVEVFSRVIQVFPLVSPCLYTPQSKESYGCYLQHLVQNEWWLTVVAVSSYHAKSVTMSVLFIRQAKQGQSIPEMYVPPRVIDWAFVVISMISSGKGVVVHGHPMCPRQWHIIASGLLIA